MENEDQYETSSGVKGDDISPYLSVKDGMWKATLIDSSFLDTPAPMKITKTQKSIMYNPDVGSYMNETKDINIEDTNEGDVSNRAFSKNYGTYTTHLKPKQPSNTQQQSQFGTRDTQSHSGWKSVASIKENNMNVCTSTFCMCPICKNPATQVCNCEKRDSVCRNGHSWHIDNGKVVIGNSHKQVLQSNNDGCVVM